MLSQKTWNTEFFFWTFILYVYYICTSRLQVYVKCRWIKGSFLLNRHSSHKTMAYYFTHPYSLLLLFSTKNSIYLSPQKKFTSPAWLPHPSGIGMPPRWNKQPKVTAQACHSAETRITNKHSQPLSRQYKIEWRKEK